ncbi:hypothetical protein Mapa_004233 [Marchantia paleacea]|nr:hypothetical protein Mapa_004233 [Marchantia paleacea]
MISSSSSRAASLSTTFQFQITTVKLEMSESEKNELDYSVKLGAKDYGGDGLAFFLVSDKNWIGGGGSNLGLFNPDAAKKPKILAVEFDTFYSEGMNDSACTTPGEGQRYNMSSTYCGEISVHLDVDNRHSSIGACASESDVESIRDSGTTFFVWIDVDGDKSILEVRISRNPWRPIQYIIQFPVDLLQVCDERMWVGFSAANGYGVSTYLVSNWTFSASLPADAPTVAVASNEQDSAAAGSSSSTLVVAISLSMLVVILLIVLLLCVAFRRRVKRRCYSDEGDCESFASWDLPRSFGYNDLSGATNSFSPELRCDEGAYGDVYRGTLPGGRMVAIKKMEDDSGEGFHKLTTEAYTLMRIRHRNVVQLLGWCKHKHTLLLVFEHLPNGSLEKALFGRQSSRTLSWAERYRVIFGVAAALAYLHEGWTEEVVHGDIKSDNVLLDEENNAKLGGFGLASIWPRQRTRSCGFLAPEGAILNKITVKTDVYAFGAVALETVCGRRALEVGPSNKHKFLRVWVEDCLHDGDLLKAVDGRLNGVYDVLQMKVVMLLGLICTDPDPDARPVMHQVLGVLSGEFPMLSESMRLFASTSSLQPIKQPQIAFLQLLKSAQLEPLAFQP